MEKWIDVKFQTAQIRTNAFGKFAWKSSESTENSRTCRTWNCRIESEPAEMTNIVIDTKNDVTVKCRLTETASKHYSIQEI